MKNAKEIREHNIELIEKCDVVLANLAPFRGMEPDSGTVYEIAYAQAKGKLVVAYIGDDMTYIDRIIKSGMKVDFNEEKGFFVDKDGCMIEDFGMPVNLMIGAGTNVCDDLETAVAEVAEKLDLMKDPTLLMS